MKVTIIKVSADGEQCSIEYNLGEKALQAHREGRRHLREELAPAFDLLDARLLEMNKRIMAANYLVQKLPAVARFAVNNVMDVLHGKTSGPAVEEVLEASRAEVAAARAKGEGGEPVPGQPERRRPRITEPVAQGAKEGPEGERISLDDLRARLQDAPVEAE